MVRSTRKCMSMIDYNSQLWAAAQGMECPDKCRTLGYIYKNFLEFISVRAPKVVGKNKMIKMFMDGVMQKTFRSWDSYCHLNVLNECANLYPTTIAIDPVSIEDQLAPGLYFIHPEAADPQHRIVTTNFRGFYDSNSQRVTPFEEHPIGKGYIPFEIVSGYAPTPVFANCDEAEDYLDMKRHTPYSAIIASQKDLHRVYDYLQSEGIIDPAGLGSECILIQVPESGMVGMDRYAKILPEPDIDAIWRSNYPHHLQGYNGMTFDNKFGYKYWMYRTPANDFMEIMNSFITNDYNPEMDVASVISEFSISLYRIDKPMLNFILQIRRTSPAAKIRVYIEISARDSELSNLEAITVLQQHGIEVVSGHFRYKVHAKVALVKFVDGYTKAHFATGNYHYGCQKTFVDTHIITDDPKVTSNAEIILQSLMEHRQITMKSNVVLTSPMTLRDEIEEAISAQLTLGDRGRIFIKCNNLCDDAIEDLLDQAVECGCDIRVVVRGINTWRPKDHMYTQKICRTCGTVLEHDRIYVFGDTAYISSADLMTRNLDDRVETMLRLPRVMTSMMREIIEQYFETPLVCNSLKYSPYGATFVYNEGDWDRVVNDEEDDDDDE